MTKQEQATASFKDNKKKAFTCPIKFMEDNYGFDPYCYSNENKRQFERIERPLESELGLRYK